MSRIQPEAAFFRQDGNGFLPLANAGSGWSGDQIRGPALSGLLARAVEHEAGRLGLPDAGMRPARWTLDLFRATPMRRSTISVTVTRRGRRVTVIDAVLQQDDRTYVRATALFLSGTDDPTGAVWSRMEAIDLPPAELRAVDVDERLLHSDGTGWTPDLLAVSHGAVRRQSWHRAVPIVEGESPSPFEVLASAADFANIIVNWGERGLEFINTDLTLSFARLPIAGEVGIRAQLRVENHGVAVGTAELFDRGGVLGVASLSALANVQHAVDPRTKRPMQAVE